MNTNLFLWTKVLKIQGGFLRFVNRILLVLIDESFITNAPWRLNNRPNPNKKLWFMRLLQLLHNNKYFFIVYRASYLYLHSSRLEIRNALVISFNIISLFQQWQKFFETSNISLIVRITTFKNNWWSPVPSGLWMSLF